MAVQSVSGNREQVIAAIRKVAQAQNADFNYLLQQAKVESGLNPDAKASTSSAVGLYQFTSGTWLGLVKKHGEQLGLGQQTQALRDGSLSSVDKESLLALRKDPELAANLAARFAADNARSLAAAGTRTIGSTELYLAHFLGSGGASTFLDGLRSNPAGAAAQALPAAARANTPIFYANGAPQSFQAIYDRFAAKFAVPVGAVMNAGAAATGSPSTSGALVSGAATLSASRLSEIVASLRASSVADGAVVGVGDEAMAGFLRSFALPNADPGLAPAMSEEGERDASVGASYDPRAHGAATGSGEVSTPSAAARLILEATTPGSGGTTSASGA